MNERMQFPPRFRVRYTAVVVIFVALLVFGGIFVMTGQHEATRQVGLLESVFGPAKQDPLVLSEQELAAFTQPSIVRLYDHVSGKVSIPDFDINLGTLDITLTGKNSSTTMSLDSYFQGSGFIVNTNGYVLTNAHVADVGDIKNNLAKGIVGLKFLGKILKLKPNEAEQLKSQWQKIGLSELDQVQAKDLLQKKVDQELLPHVSSTLSADLRVVNPNLTGKNASTSFDNAYHATLIAYHKNYIEDKKDVALIKIDAKNLPTLSLGDATSLPQGALVYAFGFPASADALSGPIPKATFTPGSVTAVKAVSGVDFQSIETNAKISPGSSGSPLLDKDGKVIGIVTFTSLAGSGDSFAFAIPISLAKDVLSQVGIQNDLGDFSAHFRAGLGYAHANHCAEAISEFKAASAANIFGVLDAVSLSIQSCAALIATGNSNDSTWDALRIAAKNAGWVVWGIATGAIVLIAGIIFVIIRLRRKVQSEAASLETEKQEITTLQAQERKLEEQFSRSSDESRAPMTDLPSIPAANPLEDYIRTAKSAGQSDEVILEALKTAGWPEDKVLIALTKVLTKKI